MSTSTTQKPTTRRIVGMVVGIVIIGLGIALFKQSHLGNDSISALNMRLAELLGISLGREQKIKLLSEACADAQWLNRMVENLLSVTRIDADGVAIQKTPTVLEELVDTVLVRFQKLHPGVPVEVKLPDDFIVIPMDSMLIQQVLTNLLENAVLHAKGMTCLTLRVFTLGQRAVFEVIDNGCGIPKERLKTLFTGTTLTQDTSSGGKHGMGIGLSVCAAIIKAHGGEIKAESTPGEGTTIRFWLETEEVDTEETEDEQ